MATKSHLSTHEMNSNSTLSTSSVAVSSRASQFSDRFPRGQAVTDGLLAKCVRFLNMKERVQVAIASHHLFDVCSSPASWSSEGVLESVHSSAQNMEPSENSFYFHGPALRCKADQLESIATNQLFKHARCIELVWNEGRRLMQYTKPLDTWSELEHLFVTDMNSVHVFSNRTPNAEVDHLPATLKSFTFVANKSGKHDAFIFLPLLPASLRTLQIIYRDARLRTIVFPDKFATALLKLTKLERLNLHWAPLNVNSSSPCFKLNSINFSSLGSPSLQISFNLPPNFVDQRRYAPELILRISAATHLRIHECSELTLDTPQLSSSLPLLTSLHIERFWDVEDSSVVVLPASIGSQIRNLSIDNFIEIEEPVDDRSSVASVGRKSLFARCGLTTITSLTVKYLNGTRFLADLPHLTHFSCNQLSFQPCTNLRKVATLQLGDWPSTHWRTHSNERILDWTEFKAVVNGTMGDSQSKVDTPSASLADLFPSLTELVVKGENNLSSCYDARESLLTIPQLKSIKWESEPLLHPNQIESYYAFSAIQDRENRKIQQRIQENRRFNTFDVATSSSSSSVNSNSESAVVRRCEINQFSLSLTFQSLTPVEVARASSVSKHWRSAALSPLVLRHHIRVEMHQLQGAQVHGPQIRISSIVPMVQATKSAVFRNLRILTVGIDRDLLQLPRESRFAHVYLRLFNYVPLFTSLHTLALNWDLAKHDVLAPSPNDIEAIRRVITSPALAHLKVLRIMAAPWAMYLMLQFLPKLKSLEVVELRYASNGGQQVHLVKQASEFAESLLQLPMLKRLYVANYCMNTQTELLDELRRFCCGVSPHFEEVMWRVPIDEAALYTIAKIHREDSSYVFPCLKSIHISRLRSSLNALAGASQAMPDLTDVSITSVEEYGEAVEMKAPQPLPPDFANRLRSLKIFFQAVNKYKGARIAEIMKSLVSSNMKQLQCLHLSLDMDGTKPTPSVLQSIENESLVQIIENCTNLTELNCPSATLDNDFWKRVLPRVHVLFYHFPINELFLPLCQNLRVLHGEKSLIAHRNIRPILLTLPHFQTLICKPFGHAQILVESRAEIARAQGRVNDVARKWNLVAEEEERKLLEEQINEKNEILFSMVGKDQSASNESNKEEGRARKRVPQTAPIDDSDSEDMLAQILASLATS